MKQFDELDKLFGTDSIPTVEPQQDVPAILTITGQPKEQDQEDDYQLSRRTLRDMIVKNDGVISDLIDLARNSEHPRTYEVVGQLVKTQSDIAKDLLGLHKQQKDIKVPDQKVGTQNNILFAGSTSELLKVMKQQNDKLIDNG